MTADEIEAARKLAREVKEAQRLFLHPLIQPVVLASAVEQLADEVERVTRERDALRAHYDAAGPEHNLLALLDLYHTRANAAEARARYLGVRCARERLRWFQRHWARSAQTSELLEAAEAKYLERWREVRRG